MKLDRAPWSRGPLNSWRSNSLDHQSLGPTPTYRVRCDSECWLDLDEHKKSHVKCPQTRLLFIVSPLLP